MQVAVQLPAHRHDSLACQRQGIHKLWTSCLCRKTQSWSAAVVQKFFMTGHMAASSTINGSIGMPIFCTHQPQSLIQADQETAQLLARQIKSNAYTCLVFHAEMLNSSCLKHLAGHWFFDMACVSLVQHAQSAQDIAAEIKQHGKSQVAHVMGFACNVGHNSASEVHGHRGFLACNIGDYRI